MNKVELWKKAVSLRKQLGIDATNPIEIFALAQSIDRLSVVYYPMGERLSGICVKDKGNSVIAVNSSMTLGRQRFSMAHELYHLYFDNELLTAICIKSIGSGSKIENEADQFASYLLMPPDALSDMIMHVKEEPSCRLSVKDIIRIEQYFKISRQALLHRLIGDGELTLQEAEPMRHNIIFSAVSLGYDDTLYRPTPDEKRYGTFGFYIRQAEEALKRRLISHGKYEELLLSAYRPDIVYGDSAEGGELLD